MSKRKNNKSLVRVIITHKSEALLGRIQKDSEKLIEKYKGITINRGTRQLTLIQDLTKWTHESVDYFIIFPTKVKQSREYNAVKVVIHLPIHWKEYYDPGNLIQLMDADDIPLYINDKMINLKDK